MERGARRLTALALARALVLLWVATEIGPELTGIDPSTREVVATATVADRGLINANQVMGVRERLVVAADPR